MIETRRAPLFWVTISGFLNVKFQLAEFYSRPCKRLSSSLHYLQPAKSSQDPENLKRMSPENRVHPYRHAFNRRREEALNELFLERTLQAQVPVCGRFTVPQKHLFTSTFPQDTTLPVVNNAEENNKYTRFLFLVRSSYRIVISCVFATD
ncbi:hypothetical protein BDP27DRAFT_1401709 [Rhodocollybia butyracea]|uniref:Uncharacterized protein n=1 Tax=Rhodocollybia butyracea TaxID=206335 RepID=A0A9P5PX83_9AGAR|nr:hypothetical protein BDP27DRAFT_1401709 [Rhodocollybia butyracea]